MHDLKIPEKHIDNNPATDEKPDQEEKPNLVEFWKSGKVIIIDDDGDYD